MPSTKPLSSSNIQVSRSVVTPDLAQEEFWATLASPTPSDAPQWLAEENYDGQLSVDVYQTPKTIVVQSTIAGVKPEDIDISITNEMITIRGIRRPSEKIPQEDYFYQECYWGGFSRSIILPVEVKKEKAEATLENGVLTITLSKSSTPKVKTIRVKEKL